MTRAEELEDLAINGSIDLYELSFDELTEFCKGRALHFEIAYEHSGDYSEERMFKRWNYWFDMYLESLGRVKHE